MSASAMNTNKYYSSIDNYKIFNAKRKSIFFNIDKGGHNNIPLSNKLEKEAGNKNINYRVLKIVRKLNSKIGPGQPEMESFKSVNSSNMVDLFTGDFSYNIPLMDVGGYPINIAYKSGISMDQEASWVGLGWNINPGTITRTLRGLPDDFDGVDSITKTTTFRDNKTIGGTLGGDLEIVGFPVTIGSQAGFYYNTYKGWGAEYGLDATITAGSKGAGKLTGGLSITNNTQDGLTIVPSFSEKTGELEGNAKGGVGGDFSIAAPYNTRTGMAGLQLSVGVKSYNNQKADKHGNNVTRMQNIPGIISFCSPAFTPTISLPYTSSQFTFTAKLGLVYDAVHPSIFASGYVSDQYIAEADMTSSRPAYGYLHYEDGAANTSSVLDFNINKEVPYRISPSVPSIGIPAYTYDAFSITGEGIGGMFRPYRSDLGYVFDHTMSTKDGSLAASVDLGTPALVHAGVDINYSHTSTKSAPWTDDNLIGSNIAFQPSDTTFEAAYFRNPGEMATNTKAFYNSIGGDDVVAIDLNQPGGSSAPTILASQILDRYKNKNLVSQLPVNNLLIKHQRDKRTQVISYLSAAEAENAGFSKYIENYAVNQFGINSCNIIPNQSSGYGLIGQYFMGANFNTFCKTEIDSTPNISITSADSTACYTGGTQESVRWTGRIKAGATTGTYTFTTTSDNGAEVWINDLSVIDDKGPHGPTASSGSVNLEANHYYNIRVQYYNGSGAGSLILSWSYPGQTEQEVPSANLSLQPVDPFIVTGTNYTVSLENRVNSFRKPNHISEIDVLNPDGKRYIYGIPVYNLTEKDVTFSVDANRGNINTGLAGYSSTDNSTSNQQGKDNYYDCDQMPAYAHAFLLTSILSPDYVDLTGNGITDDDMGDAIQFKYSKTCGIDNPYEWRAPYNDSVTYQEGLKTYNRDDKGSYLYGKKELWYLHTVESKNMIATFTVCNREDELAINESGTKSNTHGAQRLSRIDLYNKADFIKNGTKAIPIKTVHFEYDYELCRGMNQPVNDSGKLTLKKIWFTYNGNDKGKKNPYVFNYNTNNPRYSTGYYDRWGNYKSPLQNPNSTLSNFISNSDYPYALKDSTLSAYNVAAWTLDSIKLPSGGAIKVDYESDDYAYVQNRRAMEMFPIVGFSSTASNTYVPHLYEGINLDNSYIFIRVASDVTSKADVYNKYLGNISQLYFKVSAGMPDNDGFGSGYESIPGYAAIDTSAADWYDLIPGTNVIRLKLKGISTDGNDGNYNPIAKTVTDFLKLNLPSKAYPNSESLGSNVNLKQTVNLMLQSVDGVVEELQGFDKYARGESWGKLIDTTRSFARLNSPEYKKYGGGLRVKRIVIYDNWNAMTGQKESTYGQEYTYTTTQEINGVQQTISSGVASYEPIIGNEENPFHLPIQYKEQVAALAPVTLGYVEEPLGENFYPSANVGYSKVRERTIHYQNIKSANGYEETEFFTTYDFPVITDNSEINLKKYNPGLTNFLKIGARNYVTVSQGFKVELNDMDGKIKSQATYPENDSNYISYTRNYYKVDDPSADQEHLSNQVWTIDSHGNVDTTAIIGKDAELMTSMRQEQTQTLGANESANIDAFTVPAVPSILSLLSFIPLPQSEKTQYRAAATTKIIQRYGILDSVVHVDKGSKISTENLLYDSETGNPVLTCTRNEFNDSVFNFTYPADWAYDGMGEAYKNIDFVLNNVYMKGGKITSGLPYAGLDTVYFASGDEIMINSRPQTGGTDCSPQIATFPEYTKVWAINANEINGGAKNIYFIDANGNPFSGNGISLKILRSGRRNIQGSVGSVTTLVNPLIKNTLTGNYQLVLDSNSKVLNTSASEYTELWKIPEVETQKIITTCTDSNINKNTFCSNTIPANYQDTSVSICFSPSKNKVYTSFGALIYSSISDTLASPIDSSLTTPIVNNITDSFWTSNYDENSEASSSLGRLNNCGVWPCGGCNESQQCSPGQTWVGFSKYVYIPVSDTFFIGMGGDNQEKITIDNVPFYSLIQSSWYEANVYPIDDRPFNYWHIFPKYLTQGYHIINIQGWNADNGTDASFGAEIYHLTRHQLYTINDSSVIKDSTIFSTKNVGDSSEYFTKGYSCPIDLIHPFTLDSNYHTCTQNIPCVPPFDSVTCITSSICYNPLIDSSVNPYAYGILGNYRMNKSYVYYSIRAETDPSSATNIRQNGTFKNYVPFWAFSNYGLLPQYDTTKWVWNSKLTMFNDKGLEIENTDPLGRYNSGLYGYGETLPVAVTQNSRYEENAFEGFEDYNYVSSICDATCQPARHWDFSAYEQYIDSNEHHTGMYSLRIDPSVGITQIGMGAKVLPAPDDQAGLIFTNGAVDTCSGITTLQSIKADSTISLPNFEPLPGKKMVFSAWVKEAGNCNCQTYTNNNVSFIVADSNNTALESITAYPAGNIIEGWQRYEQIITLPVNAASLAVVFNATGSSKVYFDDIRLHPFNANMKSFVYNSVNLRLMAELDENNYASFYEYDDDGTLIRVKKETERGIMTIQETRSALLKDQ